MTVEERLIARALLKMARQAFTDPQIQKEYAEWKQKKKESQDFAGTGLDRLNQPISFYQIKEIKS